MDTFLLELLQRRGLSRTALCFQDEVRNVHSAQHAATTQHEEDIDGLWHLFCCTLISIETQAPQPQLLGPEEPQKSPMLPRQRGHTNDPSQDWQQQQHWEDRAGPDAQQISPQQPTTHPLRGNTWSSADEASIPSPLLPEQHQVHRPRWSPGQPATDTDGGPQLLQQVPERAPPGSRHASLKGKEEQESRPPRSPELQPELQGVHSWLQPQLQPPGTVSRYPGLVAGYDLICWGGMAAGLSAACRDLESGAQLLDAGPEGTPRSCGETAPAAYPSDLLHPDLLGCPPANSLYSASTGIHPSAPYLPAPPRQQCYPAGAAQMPRSSQQLQRRPATAPGPPRREELLKPRRQQSSWPQRPDMGGTAEPFRLLGDGTARDPASGGAPRPPHEDCTWAYILPYAASDPLPTAGACMPAHNVIRTALVGQPLQTEALQHSYEHQDQLGGHRTGWRKRAADWPPGAKPLHGAKVGVSSLGLQMCIMPMEARKHQPSASSSLTGGQGFDWAVTDAGD